MARSIEDATRDVRAVRLMIAGPAQIAAAVAELTRIEREGPIEVKAYALSTMVDAYWHGGEKEKAFVPFTQAVALYDTNPEWFDRIDRQNLFWSFKWMVSGLHEFPRVSLEQLNNTLDDMERRFALEGFSNDAPAQQRWHLATHTGSPDITALYDVWLRQTRDDMSDCELCATGDRIEYMLDENRLDDGLQLAETTLADQSIRQECFSEPATMYSYTQFAYLLRGGPGDATRAARAHHRCRSFWDPTLSLGSVSSSPWTIEERAFALAGVRGRCIEFLARSGHPEAAQELLASNQRFLSDAGTPWAQLMFFSHVGVALRVLVEVLGLGSQPIKVDVEGITTLSELWTWVRTQAEELAQAFDDRNHSAHQTEQLLELWRREPFATQVDLRVVGELPEKPVFATPADSAPLDPVADSVLESKKLVAAAEASAHRNEPETAVASYLQAADGFEATGQVSAAGFARAEAGYLALHLNDLAGAKACLTRAVSLLRAAGTPPAFAAPVATTLSECLAKLGEVEAADDVIGSMLAVLDDAIGKLDLTGLAADVAKNKDDNLRWARAHLEGQRAHNLIQAGDRAAGAILAQQTAERYADVGLIEQAAEEFQLAGTAWIGLDDDKAVWCLESAMEGLKLIRRNKQASQAANLLVELLQRLGRDEDAAAIATDF